MKPISDHYRRQCWLLARDCALASAIRMNLEAPALYARYLGAWFGGFPNDRSLREE